MGRLGAGEFCRQVGLRYESFKKSLQRKTQPDLATLAKIARHFRVDLHWLAKGEAESPAVNTLAGKKLALVRKRKGRTVEQLAQDAGALPILLERFEQGTAAVSCDMLRRLAEILGVPLAQFFQDDEAPTALPPELRVFSSGSTRGGPAIRSEDYVSIPLTDSAIAAGEPIIQENNVQDYVLLHVRAAGKRRNLVASRVDGESMEPTLHSGDIVVIDRDDKKIIKNKMYAIFHEGGLTAKYIERQKAMLVLRPLNPNSQLQIVNLDEHADPVVGRIIGAWKEL